MLIYWLLFAFPALFSLAYSGRAGRRVGGAGQNLAIFSFVVFYTLVGALRFEVGGDWGNYLDIFDDIRTDTLSYALTATDPLYGLLNWVSAQLGTDIYLVNGVCCWILGVGTVAIARQFREPWLAITMAVPYLLIVVGLGYVRQGAAIGLILIALASLERSRPIRTLVYLTLAVGFHSTAAIGFPLFTLSMVQRHRVLALVLAIIGAVAFVFFIAPQFGKFQAGYLEAEYDSQGALVRVLMGFLPAALVLARWRLFPIYGRSRSVWLLIALTNVAAMVALALSPSSTAVDRIALYVSVIQLAAFGESRALIGMSDRVVLMLRLMLIGIAAAVQTIWLVFATNATGWVPYQSIFDSP